MKIIEGTKKGRIFVRHEVDGTYSLKYVKQSARRWEKQRLEEKVERLILEGFEKRDHFLFEGRVKIKRKYNKTYAKVQGLNLELWMTENELFNLLRGASLGMYEIVGECTFIGLFRTGAQSGMLSIHPELAGV